MAAIDLLSGTPAPARVDGNFTRRTYDAVDIGNACTLRVALDVEGVVTSPPSTSGATVSAWLETSEDATAEAPIWTAVEGRLRVVDGGHARRVVVGLDRYVRARVEQSAIIASATIALAADETLAARVADAEAAATELEGRVDTAEGELTSLDGRVTALEGVVGP